MKDREIHTLATFVHGALTALHVLGIAYNLRRKKWPDAAIHMTAALYSLNASLHHAHDAGLLGDEYDPRTWGFDKHGGI